MSRANAGRPRWGREAGRPAVRVRMYRQGLGDCFLLSFPTSSGGRPFYMMIDCGVILGTSEPEHRMRGVLEDIRETTRDREGAGKGRIDLLVITHEHWDHVSGFAQAEEVFKDIDVRELWLAWTEDPTNKFAEQLREHRGRRLEALRKAVARLRAVDEKRKGLAGDRTADGKAAAGTLDTAARIEQVLGFFGESGVGTGDARKSRSDPLKSTGHALEIARDQAGEVSFRHPGEDPIPLRGVDGVRIFVLGPPENELIKRSDPTKTGREVYEMALGLDPSEAAFLGAVEEGDEESAAEVPEGPFDRYLRISEAEARRTRFFRDHYYGPAGPGTTAGPDPHGREPDLDQHWRRIEGDWLGAAGPLALKLDSDTNNTSLALAIELVGKAPESGKVLLFPGDAQVGNWLSWEVLAWDLPDGGRVTAADLLRRTVLYKVGHHASHNATLRAKGLELMRSPELVAMIPVDRTMAEEKGWRMPFPSLLARLEKKASGRILRIDDGVGDRPADVPPWQWRTFLEQVEVRDLWIEYTIPLDDGPAVGLPPATSPSPPRILKGV